MKLTSTICVVLLILLSAFSYAAFYWLGYSETSVALMATEPISLLLVELILILLSIFLCFLLLKRGRLWTAGAVMAYVILFILPWKVLPAHGALTVYGLRDRMIREYGFDGLRHFARDASPVLHDVYVDHGDESLLSSDQKTSYDKLKERYPFLRWKADGSQGPSVNDFNGVVSMDWGGPFGHWGVSVTVDGGQNDPPSDPEYIVSRVSPDIYFYMD